MADQVFTDWLAQRDPDAVVNLNSIRASAHRFAQLRLANPEHVRAVVQLALDHVFPNRTHHGRLAADLNAPTVNAVLNAWLSRPREDMTPHNIRQAAKAFALRQGLNPEQAKEVANRAVEALRMNGAPIPLPKAAPAPPPKAAPAPPPKAAPVPPPKAAPMPAPKAAPAPPPKAAPVPAPKAAPAPAPKAAPVPPAPVPPPPDEPDAQEQEPVAEHEFDEPDDDEEAPLPSTLHKLSETYSFPSAHRLWAILQRKGIRMSKGQVDNFVLKHQGFRR